MNSNRIVLILLFSLLSFAKLIAQDDDPKELARQYVEVAEGIMAETSAMDDAREVMVMAANMDHENTRANFLAGYWHIQTINKDLAVKYLLRVYAVNPNYRFDLEYWIGKSYHYGLEFDRAIDFYNRYKQKLASNSNYTGKDKIDLKVVERNIFECENGKRYVAKPLNYAIVNLGSAINSELDDYAPMLNEMEAEIVFTSRRRDGNMNINVDSDNKPFEDIFTASKVAGEWTRAKNIGAPINTIYHDSNLALSSDGKTLFLYYDVNEGDIFYSTQQRAGVWSTPEPLPGLVNSSFSENSVSISPDEKTLYFTSNRPGGFGGLDIYMATKNSAGAWVSIKNLGSKVNSEWDEEGVFIDYDGKTLYFSSRGHAGMGGYDIFKTTYNELTDEWSEPENMGYPLNTPDDDVYYVATKDGQRAYYASVKDDGLGYADIYMISMPEEKTETAQAEKELLPVRLMVTVVDENNKLLDTKIKLELLPGNQLQGQTRASEGIYEFTLTSENKAEYRLSIEQEGYMFQNLNLSIPAAGAEEQIIERKVSLRKLDTGFSTVLRNIYFDFGKASFKDASYNELNKLERMLKQNTNMKIEIAGHTDNIGSKNFNKNLSQKRANAVRDFLVSKGIDTRRIMAMGYGSEKPLASNDDEEEGRELNRRVEFRVTGN